ncbi:MAG: hypothetical protein KDK05_07850 [Candidatus Competibacteraceae bacterium]|nr:hypothetical protein [Candidatus Competibacteraceae bacterium]
MATHVLSLTDGTTTYTLTSEPYFLEEYTPGYPSLGNDGEYEPIAETISLHVGYTSSASTAAIQNDVNNVERMLQRARKRFETGEGDRIYLQIQWANEVNTWRSEVLQGEVEINADTVRAWNQAMARLRIHIVRRPFWEGPETLARMVQQYSGQSASEQTVGNYTEDNLYNFVEFSKTQISGVLPTPAIIYLSNSFGAAATRSYRSIYMAIGKFSDPSLFTHQYEAENATGLGSVVSDSSASSGVGYRRFNSYTAESICSWPLTFRQEQTGRTYRVLARFRNYGTTVNSYARVYLRNQNNSQGFWIGEEVFLDRSVTSSSFVDLGILPIPPAVRGSTSLTVNLAFAIRSSASATVDLDFVQITPLDEYRVIRPAAFSLTANQKIVDHGVDELTYVDAGSSTLYPLDIGTGNYIHLYPGVAQRLYFSRMRTDGANLADFLNVKVYYRPRRLTL